MNKYKTLAALVATALLATAGAMLVLAAIDAPYQRWNWMRKLKMTRAHPPAAAADGQPPDDGSGPHRRRGGGQPDPLRGGPEVRRRRHERPHRGRPGRGRDRPAHP
ncbi:hypothetical protein G6F32_015639 [Rhizopus arrhizus]|nr:hypothetical protein G6F32_015639 [Rhizopus arrhizus]